MMKVLIIWHYKSRTLALDSIVWSSNIKRVKCKTMDKYLEIIIFILIPRDACFDNEAVGFLKGYDNGLDQGI